MRHWINLTENYTPSPFDEFFHASSTPLEIGTTLEYRGGSGMDMQIEEILERYRPADCRNRKCVYVVTDIRALDTVVAHYEHLYVVDPQSELERYDAVWLNRIWSGLAMQDNGTEFTPDEEAKWANGYWSGQPCPREHGEQVAWEFLCDSAIVVEEIEGEGTDDDW